jgi:long-chain acyl-CoA synthetase
VQLSDFASYPNLVAMFLDRAEFFGDRPFLWAKRGGSWQALSWREAADQVCLLAESLRSLGLDPGDRVVLVSENRPEWCIADLAIMAAGLVTVPAYVTNTERDHLHVLENSGARAVIVSNAKLAQPLLTACLSATGISHIIGMEPLRRMQSERIGFHDWSALTTGDAVPARLSVAARIAAIGRSETACIIYTSGTGGAPRGVCQHHGAILCNVDGAAHILAEDLGWDPSGKETEVFLSFLPLSHAYEHTGGQYLPIGMGAQIYYAEGLEKLASNIEETRPTLMVVVPRLFEVLRARIMKQVEKQGKLPNYLMARALAIGARKAAGGNVLRRLIDAPMDFFIERTLRPKIRQRFGGRIKAMVSGGAPLNPDVGLFFDAMGLTMLQGYGQTESGPVISCNRPKVGLAMDTVGPPMRGVEVKIADDGEILVRGELVMHGYWRNDAETLRAIPQNGPQAGWLHTGDIGHFDEKGRIKITDRKKDLIINDKGDNVAPQKVEGMLTLQPEIMQAMIYGDRKPHMVAVLVPDPEWTQEWCAKTGDRCDFAGLSQNPDYRAALMAAVERVNKDLSVIERVRRFILADAPFAIENEQLTPSLKIRRHVLKQVYGERLEALYKG